jgi:hypothetical protein
MDIYTVSGTFFSSFTLSFLYLITCVYVVCATSSLLLHSPRHHASWQNLFCPLLWFCWRENIKDNKKNIAFLLVWAKGSYTERFLALFPCICVLQATSVHFYRTSSLLPSPFPIVASANLRLPYLLLNREHINHIQVLGFLPFPYSSHARAPLNMWPLSNHITAFVLSL